MDKEKEKKIQELDVFHKRLKWLIGHCLLCGLLIWGMALSLGNVCRYLFVDKLPLGSEQVMTLAVISFGFIIIYFGVRRIMHLYYYFKFLFQMLLDDLQKMAMILYSLQQQGHIIQVDDPEDIKKFLEKVGGKKPDKTTLH